MRSISKAWLTRNLKRAVWRAMFRFEMVSLKVFQQVSTPTVFATTVTPQESKLAANPHVDTVIGLEATQEPLPTPVPIVWLFGIRVTVGLLARIATA
jgi:hypothetical protein